MSSKKRPDDAKRRSYVSQACKKCQSRRTKCDGRQPCAKCIEKLTTEACVYAIASDRRRGRPSTEAVEDLQQQANLLADLISAIRTGDDANVLAQIRRGASLNELSLTLGCDTGSTVSDESEWTSETKARHHPQPFLRGTARRPSCADLDQSVVQVIQDNSSLSLRPLSNFGNLSPSSSVCANGYAASIQEQQVRYFKEPVWKSFPILSDDGHMLSRSMYAYYRYAREQLRRGITPDQLAGDTSVDVTHFFRDRDPNQLVTASDWASETIRAFNVAFADVTLLAGIGMVSKLMRWTMNPSPKTYTDVPEYLRPTQQQRLVPHGGAAMTAIGPKIRDAMINSDREFIPAAREAGLVFSWPHTMNEAINYNPYTDRITLSREFMERVYNPANWCMGSVILKAFPEAQGSPFLVRTEEKHVVPDNLWISRP